MSGKKHITILGGGPAGLAVGHYARQRGFEFDIYEAQDETGGNCRTIDHKGFLFDTGAHRLHNKNEAVTNEIKEIVGDSLKKIFVPSRIYSKGTYIDFPLTPFNLLKKIGALEFIASGFDVTKNRFLTGNSSADFREYALKTYGYGIAERFLLGYTEKLWGVPAEQLSTQVAGSRLKGLDLRTFFTELLGARVKTRHVDGEFFYPQNGIGEIFQKLARSLGAQHIHLNSPVTQVFHSDKRITAIEINGATRVETSEVVNTLPLSLLAKIMYPALPAPLLQKASLLRFRNLVLVVLIINKPSVSNDATIYFPSRDFVFTRVYEPRNRSARMSPEGRTSLIAEIPCFAGDSAWNANEQDLVAKVVAQLESSGLIHKKDVAEGFTYRLRNAYPVIERGMEEALRPLQEFFDSFGNLHQSGRSGMFAYTHIHDMFMRAQSIVDAIDKSS